MGMETPNPKSLRACIAALLSIALAGCGTPPPRDFGGQWHAVNRFDAAPRSIPLQRPYEYFASPLDGTLKVMLTRWAKDTGMTLVYQWPEDYTLTASAAGIRGPDLGVAVQSLEGIYASQGVSITATGREIRVLPASPSNGGDAGGRAAAGGGDNDPVAGSPG